MKEKINNLDISSILFLQLFSCSLGIAPYITIKITGIDAYISIIIGTIIGIIPILMKLLVWNNNQSAYWRGNTLSKVEGKQDRLSA